MANKVVAVSGGFDPPHIGHLNLIQDASKHGNVLVILNSDDWLRRKKGFVCLPWDQRAALTCSIREVSKVVPVDDLDGTVCKALELHKPDMFANGGDRGEKNTPELDLCLRLGIEPLFGIGGGKVASSSELVFNAIERRDRAWGHYKVLFRQASYRVKLLHVDPGKHLSWQRHKNRSESWTVVSGRGYALLAEAPYTPAAQIPKMIMYPGRTLAVPIGWCHSLVAGEKESLVVLELQHGLDPREDDIERFPWPNGGEL